MQHDTSTWGLRQRLIVALAVPLVIIAIVSAVLDFRVARQTADSAHDAALADTVFDLEAHLRTHDQDIVVDLSEESEAMIRSSAPDMLYFSVREQTGKVIAGDAGLPEFQLPAGEEIRFADGIYQGAKIRAAIHRFRTPNNSLSVVIVETTKRRQASTDRILQAMILPNLAVIIATLLVILLAVRQGLLPLQLAEREIATRSANNLNEIDLTQQPAEIRPLLMRLNDLFKLLQAAHTAQQRFIGDAAHQLRTPLAGLQTQLDLAVSEQLFDASPERLIRLEEATTRIGHLLTQLLVFARAETASPTLNTFEPLALQDMVEKAATTFLDASLAKQIDLGFEIAPAVVQGIPWLLNEALGNLIDNALRYTPQAGIVTVRCGMTGSRAFLEVEDSGSGIPEDQIERVFERFYRVPGTPGDGCGLGLPIVREIAQLHSANLDTENLPDGGFRIRITFNLETSVGRS